jgi:hypothetical protein
MEVRRSVRWAAGFAKGNQPWNRRRGPPGSPQRAHTEDQKKCFSPCLCASVVNKVPVGSRLSKNPSSSNKSRTADSSSCTGSPSAAPSNSDNNLPRPPQPEPAALCSQPAPYSHFAPRLPLVCSCPPTLIPPLARGKCKFRFRRLRCSRRANLSAPIQPRGSSAK